jgi:hypothetical protein
MILAPRVLRPPFKGTFVSSRLLAGGFVSSFDVVVFAFDLGFDLGFDFTASAAAVVVVVIYLIFGYLITYLYPLT